MIKGLFLRAMASALVMMAGCAYDYYDHGYTLAAGYGQAVYYDGFYGPYWDGHWRPTGEFWFTQGPGRTYRPDLGGHFSSVAVAGFRRMRDAAIQSG